MKYFLIPFWSFQSDTHKEWKKLSMLIFSYFIVTDDRFNFISYSNIGDRIKDVSLSNLAYKFQLRRKNAVQYNNVHVYIQIYMEKVIICKIVIK